MTIELTDLLFIENPNPMWIFDPTDLTIKQVNDAACDMYGYSRGEFLSLTIADLRPEEEIPKLMEEVSKDIEGFSNAGNWIHRKKDGTLLYVRILSYPILQEGIKFELITAQDVTNEILHHQELQMLLENSQDGIMLTSPDGRIHKANKAACQILGMPEEQIKNLGRDGIVLNDKKLQEALSKRSQKGAFTGELTLIHSSGQKVPVDMTTSVYKDPQGRLRTSIIFRDITKRIKLERLLVQAHEVGSLGIWEFNLETDEVYWSDMTKKLHEVDLDYKPDLETAINFYKKGINKDIIQEAVSKAIEQGIPWDEELQIVTTKGNERWVRSKGEPEMVNGQCRRIYGILQDIHERKKAHLKMTEALEEHSETLERISEAFFAVDENWTVTYWNTKAEIILGSTREQVLGNNLWEVFPEAKKLNFYKQYLQAVEKQTPVSFEEYYPPARVWVEVNAFPSSSGLSVFFRNITNRKQTELDLRRMSRIMKNSQEIAHLGSFEYVAKDQTTIWSEEEYRIYGLDPTGPSPSYSEMLENCIHPDDAKLLHDSFMEAIQNQEAYELEHRIVRPDGSVRWVYDKAHPYFDEQGELLRYVGATLDITKRKKAQEKLTLLNRAVEASSVSVIITDSEGRIDYVNPHFTKVTGYTLQEVHGDNPRIFKSGKQTDSFYEELWSTIKSGKDWIGQFKNVKKNGEFFWEKAIISPIKSEDTGKITHFVAIKEDVTELLAKEDKLKESLREKETLLAEIHHRVKNNLAIVSSMMQLQAFQEENEALIHKLHNSITRIKTIGNIHELLYKSNSFSRLHLDENLENLVHDIANTYEPSIKLEIKFDLQKIDLNINQAIPASLIVNEVTTNIFKHSFDENDEGQLWVTLTEENNTVNLQISDNGKGLPEDFDSTAYTNSLGLQLIDILTQQLDGEHEYKSSDGKTLFVLKFEKKNISGSANNSMY